MLAAVAQRLPNREIAEQLTLSARTVESHVSALLRKLALPDRRSLIELGQQLRASARRPRVSAPPVGLIGRDRELALGVERLDDPQLRLLSVTGPPGVGKTLFGLHLAHLSDASFPDGAVLVQLAAVRDPRQLLPAIADALGITDRSTRPLPERLGEQLAARHQLLVLDNVEQLVAATGALVDLLGAAPGLTALVTSRVRLRVRVEQELELAPLPVPDTAYDGDLDALGRNDAVRLFVAMAQKSASDFQLTESNAGAVAETVRRLDGLPLGLELAAARVPALGAHGVRDRLHQRLQLLTHGARDLPEHQRSLGQAIATSYDLLSPTLSGCGGSCRSSPVARGCPTSSRCGTPWRHEGCTRPWVRSPSCAKHT